MSQLVGPLLILPIAENSRKSTWRFSLPEQLHNRVGEDKRVFPAHSLNSTTNNGDPNDLFTLRRKLGDR
jgi:hypothetical protein